MATEWYLLQPPYSQTSGFEDDVMDFSKDAFSESLDSPLALIVEYCNADGEVAPIMLQQSTGLRNCGSFNPWPLEDELWTLR